MAFQSVPDTAEAVINYASYGQPMANVINFLAPGGYTQTEIDLLAAVIDLAVSDYIIPLIHGGVTYLNTHVRGLESAIDLEATNATNSEAGAATPNPLTNQQSYAVQFGTGATGRSARGRFYMPPGINGFLTNQRTVTTTYADQCVDALADLIEDAATAGWSAVVVSRYTAGALRPTGVTRVITDVIARDLNLDTQRRRVGK